MWVGGWVFGCVCGGYFGRWYTRNSVQGSKSKRVDLNHARDVQFRKHRVVVQTDVSVAISNAHACR